METDFEKLDEEQIGKLILDSAFKVHTTLGPGLLESVYEAALAIELTKRGLRVERQKPIHVSYEGQPLDIGFRADMIVNDLVLVENKSAEAISPQFKKVTTNYLRLIPLKLGYILNFNEAYLKNGIIRLTNGLEGRDFFKACEDAAKIDLKNSSPSSLPSRSSREIPIS